jgi:aryl-alcohol dehydrogenase-like predicted oxidoreductase
MKNIKKIKLGNNGPLVSKLGLGCMRMSPVWGGPLNDENESVATIQMALDNGINFLNTGDFYGSGHNELLVGKAIKGRRNDAFVSVKFGLIVYNRQILGLDLRPIAIKNFINYSLIRLGIDTIDLYQPCRFISHADWIIVYRWKM